jgi:DNA-binding HxlR family transcriptional regulator
MMELGVLERVVYPGVPPHVEYRLTAFGLKMMPILDAIQQLQHELEADLQQPSP